MLGNLMYAFTHLRSQHWFAMALGLHCLHLTVEILLQDNDEWRISMTKSLALVQCLQCLGIGLHYIFPS